MGTLMVSGLCNSKKKQYVKTERGVRLNEKRKESCKRRSRKSKKS